MNTMKRQKYMTLKDELHRLICARYATGEEWRNSCRKNEEAESKQKQNWFWMCLVVKVKSDAVKSIGNWNVRSMNQGKLEVVKQEMVRLNIDIL